MKYALVVAAAAALALSASVADAASKKHARYVRHRAPAVVVPAPTWNDGPAHTIGHYPYVSPSTCIQDEGYGRWTYCGQGRS